MAIPFKGFLLTAAGAGVNAATVDLLDRNTTTPVRETTTTNSDGFFSLSETTEGRYDVRITSGADVIWRKYDTASQMEELEVATLKIRNPADTFAYNLLPAAITAARTLTLPLLTGTATIVVTPGIEDLDMGGFDIDNAGFHILNAATAPAGTEVYLVNDNSGDLTLNALTAKVINLAIAGTDEFVFSGTSLDMNNNTLLNVGAAGNDLTQNAWTLAGGSASQSLTIQTTGAGNSASLNLRTPASGTAAPGVNFQQGDGTGSANNMSYLLSYVGGSSYLRLLSADTDGVSADADIWRVVDGGEEMILNANHGTNFDYVCEQCAKSSDHPFICHQVQAPWHADVLALREMNCSPAGFQHMIDLGIYRVWEPDCHNPVGFTGLVIQRAWDYTRSALVQNLARMDYQHEIVLSILSWHEHRLDEHDLYLDTVLPEHEQRINKLEAENRQLRALVGG